MDKQKAKRTRVAKIRFTDSEYQQVQLLADGRPLATYLRELGLNQSPPSKPRKAPPPVDPVLQRQLVGVGNNMNQIARRANQLGATVEVVEVIAQLISIEKSLEAIRYAHQI